MKENNTIICNEELESIQAQASLVAIDYWCRLNVPSLAELSCRRSLRMGGRVLTPNNGGRVSGGQLTTTSMSTEMIVTVCCKLALFVVESAFDLDEIIFKKHSAEHSEEHSVDHSADSKDHYKEDSRECCSNQSATDNPMKTDRNIATNTSSSCGNAQTTQTTQTTDITRKFKACKCALDILKMTKQISIPDSRKSGIRLSNDKMTNEIECARTYIAIYHSLILSFVSGFDNTRSLRLSQRLVELTGNTEIQGDENNENKPITMNNGRIGNHDYESYSGFDYNNRNSGNIDNIGNSGNNGNNGNKLIMVNSLENASAHLLYARILSMEEKERARNMLLELERVFRFRGYHQSALEALALHALYSITLENGDDNGDNNGYNNGYNNDFDDDNNDNTSDTNNANISNSNPDMHRSSHDNALNKNKNENSYLQFHRILTVARSSHYPVTEGLICKYIAMVSG